MQEVHPDANAGSADANEIAAELNEAREVLMDSGRRSVYDAFLSARARAEEQPRPTSSPPPPRGDEPEPSPPPPRDPPPPRPRDTPPPPPPRDTPPPPPPEGPPSSDVKGPSPRRPHWRVKWSLVLLCGFVLLAWWFQRPPDPAKNACAGPLIGIDDPATVIRGSADAGGSCGLVERYDDRTLTWQHVADGEVQALKPTGRNLVVVADSAVDSLSFLSTDDGELLARHPLGEIWSVSMHESTVLAETRSRHVKRLIGYATAGDEVWSYVCRNDPDSGYSVLMEVYNRGENLEVGCSYLGWFGFWDEWRVIDIASGPVVREEQSRAGTPRPTSDHAGVTFSGMSCRQAVVVDGRCPAPGEDSWAFSITFSEIGTTSSEGIVEFPAFAGRHRIQAVAEDSGLVVTEIERLEGSSSISTCDYVVTDLSQSRLAGYWRCSEDLGLFEAHSG